MNPFQLLAHYGAAELHLVRDEASQLEGVVAIHDLRLGPALGGCRFIDYPTDASLFLDAVRLSKGMTYKAALAGVPHGGGKAVLRRPSGAFDRQALFRAFGRFVDSLAGRYITAEDSGTTPADMAEAAKETSHVTGIARQGGEGGDPSPFTARGVRRGMEAAVKVALGADGLEGLRVAVQGVGAVGMRLSEELHARGAELVVADPMEARARHAHEAFGAEVLPLSEIHRAPVDVFAPCALGAVLNEATVKELRCKVVAGSANNQLAVPEDGDALHRRGILYAPDYLVNAGGLIHVASEYGRYSAEDVEERVEAIYDTMERVARRSAESDTPPHRVADAMAEERLAEAGERDAA